MQMATWHSLIFQLLQLVAVLPAMVVLLLLLLLLLVVVVVV